MRHSLFLVTPNTIGANAIKVICWCLLFSVAFGVFGPSLSHALTHPSAQNDHRIAVCTASGITYIRWQTTEPAPITNLSHECLICAMGSDNPIKSGDQISGWLQASAQNPIATCLSFSRPLGHWVIAAIRAPPLPIV